MIGSLIGAGLSAVGSIWGGIKASEAIKKAQRGIAAERSENDAWYNRRYNEDATQRADAQRILTKTQEAIRDRNKAAAGTAAVMGGTEESLAATKAANAAAMSEAASQIAMAGDRRKDAIEERYRNKDSQLKSQQRQMEVNKANAIAQAVQGVGKAASSIGSAWGGYGTSKPAATVEDAADKAVKGAIENQDVKSIYDDGAFDNLA